MSQLARIEQVQRPTMSRLVAALERDLLVTREVDRGDRRVVRVAATASGTGVMRYARERRVHALANLLQGLSAAELDQLGRAAELIEGLLRRG